jgi:hypothetical protein
MHYYLFFWKHICSYSSISFLCIISLKPILFAQHNNPEYSTILPCDFIKIGSTWYVAVMVTKGLGNELRTEFWRSNDLVSWSGPILSLRHPGHPGNVMLTFDVIGDYVYIFGTGGLKRNMPIYMW